MFNGSFPSERRRLSLPAFLPRGPLPLSPDPLSRALSLIFSRGVVVGGNDVDARCWCVVVTGGHVIYLSPYPRCCPRGVRVLCLSHLLPLAAASLRGAILGTPTLPFSLSHSHLLLLLLILPLLFLLFVPLSFFLSHAGRGGLDRALSHERKSMPSPAPSSHSLPLFLFVSPIFRLLPPRPRAVPLVRSIRPLLSCPVSSSPPSAPSVLAACLEYFGNYSRRGLRVLAFSVRPECMYHIRVSLCSFIPSSRASLRPWRI